MAVTIEADKAHNRHKCVPPHKKTTIIYLCASVPSCKLKSRLMTGVQAATTGTLTSAIAGVTYSSAQGFGYDGNVFRAGMGSMWTSSLTSMTSTFTTSSLTAINSGENGSRLVGFNPLQRVDQQTFNNLAGSLAGQGMNYALGGNFTLNVFNLSMFRQEGIHGGILELNFGRDGASMNFGTGGANVSFDNLASAMRGLAAWNESARMRNNAPPIVDTPSIADRMAQDLLPENYVEELTPFDEILMLLEEARVRGDTELLDRVANFIDEWLNQNTEGILADQPQLPDFPLTPNIPGLLPEGDFNIGNASGLFNVDYTHTPSPFNRHEGVDWGTEVGTPIIAQFDATVRAVIFESDSYGNYVILQDNNNPQLFYLGAHMDAITIVNLQDITAGQQVGTSGNTGTGTNPHFHTSTFIVPSGDFNDFWEIVNNRGRINLDFLVNPYDNNIRYGGQRR
jgi:hypothetical protein